MTGKRGSRPPGEAAATGGRPPLILVVDDFADNRERSAEFLRFSGYRVSEATNGHEALERAFAEPPHLVVMDLSLPGMDGWEATRRLKSDDRTAHIPVVALTAHDGAGELQRATEAGCNWFVPKPCPPAALIAEVRRVLSLP